jgi:DNA-binding NarL/FixJ family response regulator
LNVLICDSQHLFGEALAMVLTSHHWEVVGITADPAQALAAARRDRVDVCITDLIFPEGNTGIEGIASLLAASPATKVVVLTATSEPMLVVRAVEAGAHAILFKDDHIDHIVEVVASVGGGATGPVPSTPRPEPTPSSARQTDALGRYLTDREYEILEHLVHGRSGKNLAQCLDVSYATVRTHIQNILTKLGVHSTLEAVAFAMEHDLCT